MEGPKKVVSSKFPMQLKCQADDDDYVNNGIRDARSTANIIDCLNASLLVVY